MGDVFSKRFVRFAAVFIGVMILVSLVWSYVKLGHIAIDRTNSANAALATSLKGELSNLPKIDSITAGYTSGNLDHVLTARKSLSGKLTGKDYSPRQVSLPYRPFSFSGRLHTDHADYNQIRQNYATQINLTVRHLTELKKLVEYNAAADLGDDLASDPTTSERLERTKNGLEQALKYIGASSLSNKQSLLDQLTSLTNEVTSLTDQNKASWIDRIVFLQKDTIQAIAASDIQQINFPKDLDKIDQQYHQK